MIGKFNNAKNCYEKAIKINPNFASAYNNLGLIFLKNKDKPKAIDLFNKAIEIDPNLANANYGFSYLSNAGGAFLEWLEGDKSPGVKALENNNL